MNTKSEILEAIKRLNGKDRSSLLEELVSVDKDRSPSDISAALEKIEQEQVCCCGHCKSTNVRSHGYQKGIRRLYCKDCKRTSSSIYGTAGYWIHKKDKWDRYLQCMDDGLSLRKTARRVGISYQTAFNWRHKILKSLSNSIPTKFNGIVESDEMYIHYSQKGNKHLKRKGRKRGQPAKKSSDKVAVIAVADREGNTLLQVAGRKGLKRNDVDKALQDRLGADVTLCTDGHTSYKSFALDHRIKHKKIISWKTGRTLKNKAYHIQTTNALHKQTRDWLRKFNGVSTKYLQHYLYWFMTDKKFKNQIDRLDTWLYWSITYTAAWRVFYDIHENNTLI